MFIRFLLCGPAALGLVGMSALLALAADDLDNGNTTWILSATALMVSVIILIFPEAMAGLRLDD